MVLLNKPKQISGKQATWKTVEVAAPLKVQRRVPDAAEAAMAGISAALTGKKVAESLRVVSVSVPAVELATASSREEVSADVEILLSYLAGVEPEKPVSVPESLKQALAKVAPEARGGGSKALNDAAAFAKQLEPWARVLMDNSGKLRYVCYAFKVATSLGADVATAGLGGEEAVGLCFTSVDAAILSSWLVWFTAQLSDESPADNVVRQTLAFDFAAGPRGVMEQADAVCASMRPEDVERITHCAMTLKRRFAVLVGDIISLLIPNDMGVGGALVTEMLMRLEPSGAVEALKQLIIWYEMIKPEHRQMIEDRGQLTDTMQAANNTVRTFVLGQYDKSLQQKGIDAATRGVVSLFIPGAIVVNMAASSAILGNVGRSTSADVFDTLDNKMNNAAVTMHSVFGVAIGTLVVMAHCADKADSTASKDDRKFSVMNVVGGMIANRTSRR